MLFFYFLKKFIKIITPSFLLDFYHYLLAGVGALLYNFPSSKIKVIGITGTSGKSTTVDLTTKILEEAGYKTASISSIRFKIGEKEWKNDLKMTMPGRFKIQKFLKKAINANCKYVVLEVTSEGIKQYRHKFIKFDVAVFTNLTPEHIEAHGGFEEYKNCKGKLFQVTKGIHIINLDDKNSEYYLQFSANQKWGYTIKKNKEDNYLSKIVSANIYSDIFPLKFSINGKLFKLNLFGRFNIYNALAGISVGLSQGVSLDVSQKALEKVKEIPGRMEVVIREPFKVVVDYAITPTALEKVYQTLTAFKKDLICVLGSCGGGRDKWKRPVLGEIAAKYCQKIIITNEDPYDENPMEIINQVAIGAERFSKNNLTILKILDRREAIKRAMDLAKKGDWVIITGKGSESLICLEKGRKIPWDDRKVVREEFKKLANQKR